MTERSDAGLRCTLPVRCLQDRQTQHYRRTSTKHPEGVLRNGVATTDCVRIDAGKAEGAD